MDYQDFIRLAGTTNKRSHDEIVARLIVDAKRLQWYFIPSNTNHDKYVADNLLKLSLSDIEANPAIAENFVGVAIDIINNEISAVVTGISGLETRMKKFKKPFHAKGDVNAAHAFVLDMLTKIGAVFARGFKAQVVYI